MCGEKLMSFIIIGLCGGMGSGKTTLARQIAFDMPLKKCRITSFGNRLKDLVSNTYGIPIGLLHSEKGKNTLPQWASFVLPVKWAEVPQINHKALYSYIYTLVDVRKVLELNMAITEACVRVGRTPGTLTCGRLLQIVGETFRQYLSDNVWIKALQETAINSASQSGIDVVIIDDVRYENEASWITSKGGFLIKLEGIPPTESAVAKRDNLHPSEKGLPLTIPLLYTAKLGQRKDDDFAREGAECAKLILKKYDKESA